jgi:hypothetical protein
MSKKLITVIGVAIIFLGLLSPIQAKDFTDAIEYITGPEYWSSSSGWYVPSLYQDTLTADTSIRDLKNTRFMIKAPIYDLYGFLRSDTTVATLDDSANVVVKMFVSSTWACTDTIYISDSVTLKGVTGTGGLTFRDSLIGLPIGSIGRIEIRGNHPDTQYVQIQATPDADFEAYWEAIFPDE